MMTVVSNLFTGHHDDRC